MKMIMEKQMECRLAGETEVLGENLPQRHFVHFFLNLPNPSSRTMALRSTQLLIEISTRNIPGDKERLAGA
jgi:hypothetical protein